MKTLFAPQCSAALNPDEKTLELLTGNCAAHTLRWLANLWLGMCLSLRLPFPHPLLVKKRITIISTSIAYSCLKPIFLGRGVRVWGRRTVGVCQPSVVRICFWDMRINCIWDWSNMGVWLQVCFFFTPLPILLLSTEAEGDLQICIPLISRLIRNGESKVVINIDEVFWGIGRDMLHVHTVWAIRSLSAEWIKSNNLNLVARAHSQS